MHMLKEISENVVFRSARRKPGKEVCPQWFVHEKTN